MRKELLNKANLAWLLLSVVSFIVLTILMKVGIMIFKPTGILGTKELSFKKLFDKRKEKSA